MNPTDPRQPPAKPDRRPAPGTSFRRVATLARAACAAMLRDGRALPGRALPGRALRDRRGSVAVEAGLTLTLLAFATLAAFDGARYLKLMARAERVAGNLADIAARSDSLRDRPVFDAGTLPNDTGMLFELSRLMLDAPASAASASGVIVSAVSGTGSGHTVRWTRASAGLDASDARLSALGPLPAGAEFIVAEVIAAFQSVALDVSALGVDGRIYSRAVFRTRHGGAAALEAP